MNRKQKRDYIKMLKSKNINCDKVLAVQQLIQNHKSLEEGQKVKLNIDKIKSYKDYNKSDTKYKEWVNTHYNKVFTVQYDEKYKDNPTLVCLKEDETDPKWLFWGDDLIKLE